MTHTTPTLIIIGGHEDRTGDKPILEEVARRNHGGKIVVVTVASQEPDGLFREYRKAFHDLGVKEVVELAVADREQALDEKTRKVLDGARTLFFTGGDQLRITSQLGDTPVYSRVKELYDAGGLIAGTSAGASVMCETMLVSGEAESSPKIGEAVRMAPGFGLLGGVVIDQHFAERGRMGRLIGAVAQNPAMLGIGIDEKTAIVVQRGRTFRVIGEGGVYVLDAAGVTASNLSDEADDRPLSIFDVKLHLLGEGDTFDLKERHPTRGKDS